MCPKGEQDASGMPRSLNWTGTSSEHPRSFKERARERPEGCHRPSGSCGSPGPSLGSVSAAGFTSSASWPRTRVCFSVWFSTVMKLRRFLFPSSDRDTSALSSCRHAGMSGLEQCSACRGLDPGAKLNLGSRARSPLTHQTTSEFVPPAVAPEDVCRDAYTGSPRP